MKNTTIETMDLDLQALLDDCVAFTQRLIQTPSMPGYEADIAEIIAAELRQLGFDEVWIDGIGNVNGRIWGQDRSLPTLVLNSHLDHVDPGDLSLWATPPYGGVIADGRILGRGACDIKGPLAVQVYAMAGLLRAGRRPKRDVVFTGVVQEEVGGAGADFWAANCDYEVALVVLGEPSENRLSLGHRGLYQMWVTFTGRSVHASVPENGENPNYALASFLQRLHIHMGELSAHPILGQTSVAPTLVEVDTRSANVTPAWTRVLLDFRTASESPNSLRAFVSRLAQDLPHHFGDIQAGESNPPDDSDEVIFGYYTAPDSPEVGRFQALVARETGRAPELCRYEFATDGRLLVPYEMTVLGYSPAEEHLAHTVRESISIDLMAESLRGHISLLADF